jgi:TRAP-type C4-dicarboxylate transport system substrate-binding protein
VLGAAAMLLTGCVGEEQTAVGVDSLDIALPGAITESQQAFVDRMNELSGGSIAVNVHENWEGGEAALTKAVQSGEVDMAWITVRSLSSIGIENIGAFEAPQLIRTHDQQRAVALGVPAELVIKSLRDSGIVGLAMIPGPIEYPIAAGAPILDVADWSGKTVQVGSATESATVEALGGSPSADGTGGAADVVSGAVAAATADPRELTAAGVTKEGPFLTANMALWPRMQLIVINKKVHDRLSTRQNGFLDGSVVRSQDLAMASPDLPAALAEACTAGALFGTATADQLTALTEATQSVYDALRSDPGEKRLLESIEDAVKRNAGTGALPVPKACRWAPPAA